MYSISNLLYYFLLNFIFIEICFALFDMAISTYVAKQRMKRYG